MKTIIFLSGLALPKFISKSPWFFQDSFWKNYNRIYYKSKIPSSNSLVEEELFNLTQLVNTFSNVSLIGHSLGAWWAANLACESRAIIKKMILWTPLGTTQTYPIFNVSSDYEPINKIPNKQNTGKNNVLTIFANKDLVVPFQQHSAPLINLFESHTYQLNGGHVWQYNHVEGLNFSKKWIESS